MVDDVIVGAAVTLSAPPCDEVKWIGTPAEVVADMFCEAVEDRPAIEGVKERNLPRPRRSGDRTTTHMSSILRLRQAGCGV
jgi:hypothetical protein